MKNNGPPYVRAIGPLKAVAGVDVTVYCPFSGYPIEQIRWEKGHHELTSNSHYSLAPVQQGGYIVIKNVEPTRDQGMYTCIVKSRAGEEARRDMQLNVNSLLHKPVTTRYVQSNANQLNSRCYSNRYLRPFIYSRNNSFNFCKEGRYPTAERCKGPPVIEPFKFPKNLQEGGRAQITCAVSSGDMPIYFSWKKDDMSIPTTLQITEKKEEFFSLLVFKDISAKHSGKYTCYASNAAAKVNFTAELQVRVAPRWSFEPMDTAIMLGNTISINCEAEGYPIPAITWFKGQDVLARAEI
uniref:Ig-like domain-containing protein n=1 Tax=Glossina austeni TaxID=7395 RepID=A0A1A9UEN5_GLOAU